MKSEQFQQQMNRLVEQFGKTSYGTERCKLVWQEVSQFEIAWFSKVIDKFIGECRQPPLMPEFREEASKERERLWQIQKEQKKKDANDFFEGTYQPKAVATFCQDIKKRIMGQISDEAFEAALVTLLAHTANQTKGV